VTGSLPAHSIAQNVALQAANQAQLIRGGVMTTKLIGWGSAIALLTGMSSSALAGDVALPPSTTLSQVDAYANGVDSRLQNINGQNVSLSVSQLSPGSALGQASVINDSTIKPYISVVASAAVNLPPVGESTFAHGSASGNMSYALAVEGPTPTVAVQISALGFMSVGNSAGVHGYFAGQVQLGIFGSKELFSDSMYVSFGDGAPFSSQTSGNATLSAFPFATYQGDIRENGVWVLNTNTLYTVSMSAVVETSAVAQQSEQGDGSLIIWPAGQNTQSAYVDPHFQIAPGTMDASAYSFLFSPGVGNAPLGSPGPVPGAGLLSLAFFLLAGAFTKTRTSQR
jgi:hypothetical protein